MMEADRRKLSARLGGNLAFAVVLIVVLVAAIAVAGCGGSSDASGAGGDSTAPVLTKAAFIKQGDAICQKGGEEVEAAVRVFTRAHGVSQKSEPTKDETEELAEQVVIPGIKSQVRKLGGLNPPPDEAGRVEKMLGGLEAAIKAGEEDPMALMRGEVLSKPDEKVKAFGFKVCGGQG